MDKQYDQAYFDKWYRDQEYAVNDDDEVARKAAMAISVAEYYLGRPIENVLDIGCGEGHWRAPLLAMRPLANYQGLDASAYVVDSYGAERHIAHAGFQELACLRFAMPFDLIICSNLLHYLDDAEIRTGMMGLDELLEGAAFIEVYTADDDIEGDAVDFYPRSASWYQSALEEAGLVPVGSYFYVGSSIKHDLLDLESPWNGQNSRTGDINEK